MYVPLKVVCDQGDVGYVEIPTKPRTWDEYTHDVEVEANLNGIHVYTSEWGHAKVVSTLDISFFNIEWTREDVICPGEPHEGSDKLHTQREYENCLWLRFAMNQDQNPDVPHFRSDWDREYEAWNAHRMEL